jgi:hypothetical protein
MSLLKPDWNQPKPTYLQAQAMCRDIALEPIESSSQAITNTLERLRASHSNGGAFLASVRVGPSPVFDWYASRNRLLEWDILPLLLRRREIKALLPELSISDDVEPQNATDACSIASSNGFKFDNPFVFDGQLAQNLFAGGAYGAPSKINGKAAKQIALEFCEAVFGQRYEDVSLFTSYEAWTPWFRGIAWDWTAILFDRRERSLWILVVTDTD